MAQSVVLYLAKTPGKAMQGFEVVVIGGGCYGSYHARQLRRAWQRGKLPASRILVVDRDPDCAALRELGRDTVLDYEFCEWEPYLASLLGSRERAERAYIVPAPFTPHLYFRWLADELKGRLGQDRVEVEPCDLSLGLPYEHLGSDGNLYFSAADWTCPVTCVEPAICPHTRAPKDWDLETLLTSLLSRPGCGLEGVILFPCRPLAHAISAIPARLLLEARERVLRALTLGGCQRWLVATISSCHGVAGLLKITP
jgi:hypothetical protein